MLSRRSALLRPAPTPARPRNPFPGFAGYRRTSLPAAPQRRGQDGSPQFPGQPSVRSMPNTPEGPSASAPGSQTPSMAFTAHKPARLPLFRPKGRGCDDACSGFTHVTDRTVAPAPLRTQPLDHARGHSYQGPRHLPRPDSHRPAVPNLSLDLRHDELLLLTTPKQSGRTYATATVRCRSVSAIRRRTRIRAKGEATGHLDHQARISIGD
jgi:hypothetical protein